MAGSTILINAGAGTTGPAPIDNSTVSETLRIACATAGLRLFRTPAGLMKLAGSLNPAAAAAPTIGGGGAGVGAGGP